MKIFLVMAAISALLTGCYSVDKGTTTIIPVNVAKNGVFCGTKSITAARYMPNGYVISQTNENANALKYTASSEEIYTKLKANIGKPVVIEYSKDWFYINPCIKDKYIITNVK